MRKIIAIMACFAITTAAGCAQQPSEMPKERNATPPRQQPPQPSDGTASPDIRWEKHDRPSIKATVYYPAGWKLRNIGPEDSREFGFYERPVAPGGHEASVWFSMVPQTDGYDRSIQSLAEDGWEVQSLTIKGNSAFVATQPRIVENTRTSYVQWVIKTADRSYMVSLEIAPANVSSEKVAFYKQLVKTMVEKMEIAP